ncbi:MAG: lyase [Woeseiaceae bacterium]
MKSRIIAAGLVACMLCCPQLAVSQTVDIREWEVPWTHTRPRDPFVDASGRVWFVGQAGHYVANLEPSTGEFARYDLEPGTGPHNLIVSEDGSNTTVWYAGNLKSHIGRLDPGTGTIEKIMMPDSKARDPHTLVFDSAGDIWFTVQGGNFVGKLATQTEEVSLTAVPTQGARPYGIVINSKDEPWVVEFGSNKLIRIDKDDLTLEEIELPDERSRPRRLQVTSDDNVWYGDYALGRLGRYEPDERKFTDWALPSGKNSRPYGMAVDKHDRLWIVETGVSPNRLIGFDTRSEAFLSETDIPSGAGSVRHMYYFEPTGEVWFGTDTNTIGRAKVH